jgi:colanic acid/amylovoran biosynthesis glycosyltransferase
VIVEWGASSNGDVPAADGVAYVCDQYPAISHSFILREVLALRRLGMEVDTLSIRRADPRHVLSSADRSELQGTFAVLPIPLRRLVRAHLSAVAKAPWAYLRTMLFALRLGLPSLRDALWQLFYFAEAVVLWRECERRGRRHVHAQFTSPAADVALLLAELGRRLGGSAGGPWSWSFAAHGADIQQTDSRRLARKVRRATFVICVSEYGRSQLMALVEPDHWSKLHVVRCGVDPTVFSPVRRTNGRDRDLHVLHVGRLVPVKGQAVLLEAIALLVARGVGVRATIVGDGPERPALERLAGELGILDRVTFTGYVGQDDIRRYYETADVFCLPSFNEGVPVVLMEAMAMEVPAVASRITGIPELIDDGATGLLVPPGRADKLADALETLAAAPELRRRLGSAGRRIVAEEFNLDRSAQQLRGIFTEAGGIFTEAATEG